MAAEALFVPDGDGFRPTDATLGPWGPTLLHGGAVSALCVLLLEELGGPELVSTRFSIDLVRPVTVSHLDVEGKVVRTGRRLQLVEATLLSGGKLAGRASLLRLRPEPVELPPGAPASPSLRPPPDAPEQFFDPPMLIADRPVFAGTGIEMRVPDPDRFGAGVAWFRLMLPVLPGRPGSAMARAAAAADFGNGVSGFRGPDMAVAFPNADLTVYLSRPVEGEWVRLEATSIWGDDGIGLTHSMLADLAGPVGVAQQSLVLSPAAG